MNHRNPNGLSEDAEMRLRKCFRMLKKWSANGLLMRLQEDDIKLPSTNAAQILIGRGVAAGLLLREGPAGHSTYRLNYAWERVGGYRNPPLPSMLLPPGATGGTVAYTGPALGNRALAPHLGMRRDEGVDADGELLPCIGGAIVDHLRGQFREAFAE